MILTLIQNKNHVTDDGNSILLWKFQDEDGNFWHTQTDVTATENDAILIITNNI